MTYSVLSLLTPDELRRAPCTCIWCNECRGTGTIWVEGHLNAPFDEPESCDHCRGRGLSELCDRCSLLDALEGES